jgi:TatD DNase family protein
MQLTDTHCHIHEANLELMSEDMTHKMWGKLGATPDDLLVRAAEKGVTRVICVGCTLADSQRAVDFVQDCPGTWASIGLHPHEAKDGQPALDGIASLAGKPKVVAVGEIGLDYYYGHSEREDQIKALRFQIELALAHDLPIIFHVRDAFDDFWPIFDDYKGIRGVLHSYTDNFANFEQAMKRNLYIGINGIMTFTKVEEQLRVAKAVPLQKILLETDAPFLTPKPFRGTVNEPAHVRLVTEFLADLRNESIEDLATQTTRNAQTLFSLD